MSSTAKKTSDQAVRRGSPKRSPMTAQARARIQAELESFEAEISELEANEAALQDDIKALEKLIDGALKTSAKHLPAAK